MALLAATTLGTDVAAEPVHAEVRVDAIRARALKRSAFRLIVQSYDAPAADMKAGRAKPVGSMQRLVSAEELKNGIRIEFVELRDSERLEARPLVVAWLEAVQGTYELDAREARPRPGSVYGYAHRDACDVKIRLDRRA